jgi:hypothetical protein
MECVAGYAIEIDLISTNFFIEFYRVIWANFISDLEYANKKGARGPFNVKKYLVHYLISKI